jgi:hypothetical protein
MLLAACSTPDQLCRQRVAQLRAFAGDGAVISSAKVEMFMARCRATGGEVPPQVLEHPGGVPAPGDRGHGEPASRNETSNLWRQP